MSNTAPAPPPGASSAGDTPGMPLPTCAGRRIEPLPPTTPSPNPGTGPARGSAPAPRALTPPLGSSSSSSASSLSPQSPRAPSPPPPGSSAAVPGVPSPMASNSSDSNPVPMSSPPAGDLSPLPPPAAQPRVRARRTGAHGLDIHVHWADKEPEAAAAAAPASSATAAPAVASAAGPPNAGVVRPPPTPYTSPTPVGVHPQAYVISPAQPVWGGQAPMPVLVTNPPIMTPSVPAPAPGSSRWCYPNHSPSPFGNNTTYYFTSPQPVVFPPVPTGHVATPLLYTSPQSSVIFYPTG